MNMRNTSICPFCKQPKGNPTCAFCKQEQKKPEANDADARTVQIAQKLEQKAPQLIKLVQKVDVYLKQKNIQNLVAKVAFVLDASGSMAPQYNSGNVQSVLERIMAVAIRLDDDGELEAWAFASQYRKLPTVTLENVKGYVERLTEKTGFWRKLMSDIIQGLGFENNEPPVMRDVMGTFAGTDIPAFVVFISDGGIDKENDIKKVLIEASQYPIFWQFVGLGGSNYSILERLDTMGGRVVDNANFFHIDDFRKISDDELYNRLLNEFPRWLKEARAHNILQ
jgi:hypothetical protein